MGVDSFFNYTLKTVELRNATTNGSSAECIGTEWSQTWLLDCLPWPDIRCGSLGAASVTVQVFARRRDNPPLRCVSQTRFICSFRISS